MTEHPPTACPTLPCDAVDASPPVAAPAGLALRRRGLLTWALSAPVATVAAGWVGSLALPAEGSADASGDAVRATERGEIVFLDRVEHLVKLAGGHAYPPQFIETRLRFSPFIKDVMVLGDATRPWVGALVNIDMGVASRWAEERRIAFSTFTDLSQRPEIRALVRDEIARINAFLPEGSRVVRFANFPKELDPDEGELTRSRKLRREFLQERYRALIVGLYDGSNEVQIDIPVTYQDGRKSQFRAQVRLHDVFGKADAGRGAVEEMRA